MGLWILWKGITLGLGAAAPIGPVNVEIARRAIRGGFFAGFLLGLGAVTVDVTYVVLASFSVRLFLHRPRIMLFMGVAGGAFLILLGIECLRAVRKQWAEHENAQAGPPPRRNYLTGLVMTALNPMTLAFWFFAPKMTGVKEGREMPLLCAGVAVGTFSWVCFFAALMTAAGKKGKQRAVALANLAGGLTLLGFGGRAIWQVVRPYL
jgi:L-lysine exporter family protein LysE/ArgO